MSKLPLLSSVDDGRATVVHMHSNRDISRGLLRKILNEIELSREEFLKNL